MSATPQNQYYKVGVLLFQGADILDFTGPVEVLSHVSHNCNPDDPDRMFTVEIIAQSPTIRAANTLTLQADRLLTDALNAISEYDILVVPGGPPSILQPMVEGNGPEIEIIRRFARLPRAKPQQPRLLFSVCTGAFLLAASGVLSGLTVTTHHRAINTLREICIKFGDQSEPPTNVVHKRYIDGGNIKGDAVHVITAGGVSSGLDASFYVVRQLATPEMAAFVSRLMEYDWTDLEK
ncbi:ThiJ/PfpI family protein [Penicillium canariense]|uniref:ThiJ/PfpI family protein n=1 Tax=Penicillium canariense TaxID=189055 RepID=A0A9W9IK78_9EURO|nr:ThiJ/PfpI family protein [Penicillium canariense]KAJ5177211.1 ThiJ/PfpI family protein [Penicillium canariense]